MTQRGEEFAKLPAGPCPRPPRGWAGGHSWVPGRPNPSPAPRRGVRGGCTSALPSPSPSWRPAAWTGSDWAGLGSAPSSLGVALLPPPSFPDVQRKRSEKDSEKGSREFPNEEKNHLWRAEGARVCVRGGSPHSFREETLGSRETGDTSGTRPAGIPPAFPGPPGAWAPASWVWDSGVEGQSAPDLMEASAGCSSSAAPHSKEFGVPHQEGSAPGHSLPGCRVGKPWWSSVLESGTGPRAWE